MSQKIFTFPALANNVYSTQEEAVSAPVAKFQLKKNIPHKYYYNHLYHESEYNAIDYQNSQATSNRFYQHMLSVANEIKLVAPLDSKIIEIGCGKGIFVDLLVSLGFDSVTGYDSTYQGESPLIRKRYFSKQDYNLSADVILLRHTLEHIPNPASFLEDIYTINNNKNCKVVIEVPSFEWSLESNVFWDLTHEHCNYFTSESMMSLFPSSQIKRVFENQFLLVVANLGEIVGKGKFHEEASVCNIEALFPALSLCLNTANSCVSNSVPFSRYWVWGIGIKAVMYLWNRMKNDPLFIPPLGCIDINPSIQGKYISCLGYKVHAPEVLFNSCRDDDVVCIMNPAYNNEIEAMVLAKVNNTIHFINL